MIKELKSFTSDKKVRGEQKITVKKIQLADISKCHVLIVTRADISDLSKVIKEVGNNSTLIITEQSDKTPQGAGISFMKDKSGIVKYQYSEKNIKTHQIDVSTSFREVGISK